MKRRRFALRRSKSDFSEQKSEFEHSRAAVELAEAVARLRVIEQLRHRRA